MGPENGAARCAGFVGRGDQRERSAASFLYRRVSEGARGGVREAGGQDGARWGRGGAGDLADRRAAACDARKRGASTNIRRKGGLPHQLSWRRFPQRDFAGALSHVDGAGRGQSRGGARVWSGGGSVDRSVSLGGFECSIKGRTSGEMRKGMLKERRLKPGPQAKDRAPRRGMVCV